MEIKYDKKADAAYFRIRKGKIANTKELAKKVLVDLDKKGNVLGVEILNASLKFKGKKQISPIYKFKIPLTA